MITSAYPRFMVRYNDWQNETLIEAANGLDDEARRGVRESAFRSIHNLFHHLLWMDHVWMNRLGVLDAPDYGPASPAEDQADSWDVFLARRKTLDGQIADWAAGLGDADLAGDVTWTSKATGNTAVQPRARTIVHFFNNQTHMRAQIRAMLLEAGAKPGPADIPFMSVEDGERL